MSDIFTNLTKAIIGDVVETPIAIVEDIITLGGIIEGKEDPNTITSLKKVVKNISNITD